MGAESCTHRCRIIHIYTNDPVPRTPGKRWRLRASTRCCRVERHLTAMRRSDLQPNNSESTHATMLHPSEEKDRNMSNSTGDRHGAQHRRRVFTVHRILPSQRMSNLDIHRCAAKRPRESADGGEELPTALLAHSEEYGARATAATGATRRSSSAPMPQRCVEAGPSHRGASWVSPGDRCTCRRDALQPPGHVRYPPSA